jgi:hypothetical protein
MRRPWPALGCSAIEKKYLFNTRRIWKYSKYGTSFIWDYRRIPEPGTYSFVKRSAINVSVKVKLINERRKYISTPFATSELGGVGGHRQPPAALTPGKRPGTHCTGSCVGTRVGVDGLTENFAPTGIRFSDSSTCSKSLYRLGYAGRQVCWQ